MNELLQILNKTEPERSYLFLEWSKKQYHRLILLKNDEISLELNQLFNYLLSIKANIDVSKIQFYVSVLSLFLFLNPEKLPVFPLETDNQDLFLILTQIMIIKKVKMSEQLFLELFNYTLSQLSTKSRFYDITPLYYYQNLPELIKSSFDTKSLTQLFAHFFNCTKKLSFQELNFSSIEYLSKVTKQFMFYLPKDKSTTNTENILSFFDSIFHIRSIFSSTILSNFANSWLFLLQLYNNNNSGTINTDKHFALLAQLIENNTTYKVHELFRLFSWKLYTNLISTITKPQQSFFYTNLLLMAYRSIMHFECLKDMQKPSETFLSAALESYDTSHKWLFYSLYSFFISNLQQTILKSRKPFYYFISNTPDRTFPEFISFSEQTDQESVFDNIDHFIHTFVHKKSVLKQDISSKCDELFLKLEIMKARISTSNFFLFSLISKTNNNVNDLAIVLHGVKTYFSLLIHLHLFKICKSKSDNQNLPNYSIIFNDIMSFLSNIQHSLIPSVSSLISKLLFKAARKNQLTVSLLESLNSFSTFYFDSLVMEMINLVFSSLNLFFSQDIVDVRSICNFVLIVVRMILSKQSNQDYLTNLLNCFKKIIIGTVLGHIKSISHQKLVFQMIKIFIKQFDLDASIHHSTLSSFFDVLPCALRDFFYPFLYFLEKKYSDAKMPQLIEVLCSTFRYGDKDAIELASDICSDIFRTKEHVSIQNHDLYQLWINSTKTPDQFFVSNPNYFNHNETTFNENISFASIYHKISLCLCDNPEVILSALNVFKMSIFRDDNSFEEMCNLLHIFQQLFGFNYINQQLQNLIPKILEYHTGLFLSNRSNLFFLASIHVSSIYRSHISNEMRDISISFMNIIVNKNPECEMLKTTAEEILYKFHQATRAHSIISAVSIFLRFAPQLVDFEMIRFLLITMNDVSHVNLSLNQLLATILRTFTSRLNHEDKKRFCQMILDLNRMVSIHYRLVIVDVLKDLDCNLDDYSISANPQCPFLEMQQTIIALCCHVPITPDMTTSIHQYGNGNNDRVCAPEGLSRKMSVYMASLATPYNFNTLFKEQPFALRVMHFLSNALASNYKCFRNIAKQCFSTIFTQFADHSIFSRLLSQMQNPIERKVLTLLGDQPERIIYYKRFIQFNPSLITPQIVVKFLEAIYQYLQKPIVDQIQFMSNIKYIYSFLGMKEILNNQIIHDTILKHRIQNVDGFMFYVQSYIQLRLINGLSVYPIIRKSVLSFLSSFPNETIQTMVFSTSQYYQHYLDLIDINDNSNILNNKFIAYCSTVNPFVFPVHIWDVFEAMASIESCARNTQFLKLMDSIYLDFLDDYNSKIFNLKFYSLFKLVSAMTKTFQYVECADRLLNLMRSLAKSLIISTIPYDQIINRAFEKTSDNFKYEIIAIIAKDKSDLPPIVLDNCLQHCIKHMKKIPTDVVSTVMEFSLTKKCLFSITRLISIEKPTVEQLTRIYSILSEALYSSDSYEIIHAMKLMHKLGTLHLLESEVYWKFINHIFRIYKFTNIPYTKYTNRLLKLINSDFQEVPVDVIDSVLIALQGKSESIRDLNRIIEIIGKCPNIEKLLPFSPLLVLSKLIEFKLNGNDSISTIEPSLDAGFKFLANCEVDEFERQFFLAILYKIIVLMLRKLYSSKILDIISVYISTKDIPIPPGDLLIGLKAQPSDDFRLISFISVFILIKTQPEIMVFQPEIINRAVAFVNNTENQINTKLLQPFFEFMFRCPPFSHYANDFLNTANISVSLFNALVITNVKFNTEEIFNIIVQKKLSGFVDVFQYNKEIQYSFAQYLIKKSNEVDNNPYLMSIMIEMITSDCIFDHTKKLLMANIAKFINCLNVSFVFEHISQIEQFCESKSSLIEILIETARCSSIGERIKTIQRIIQILPNDQIDTFHFLTTYLNVILWRNDTLIYVLSLFAFKQPKLFAILSFGSAIGDQAVNIAIILLKPLLNEATINIFSAFLLKLLNSNNFHLYDHIISALNYLFFNCNSSSDPLLLTNAVFQTNQPLLLFKYLDDFPLYNLSYSNWLNDVIYSRLGLSFKISERSAVYMTLLHNYDLANRIYSELDWDDDDHEKIRSLSLFSVNNNSHLYNHQSFDQIIKDISETEHFNNPKLYSTLRDSIVLLEKNDFKKSSSLFTASKEILNSMFSTNMLPIEKEKYIFLTAFVELGQQLCNQKLNQEFKKLDVNSLQFEESLDPSLYSTLLAIRKKFTSILKNKPIKSKEMKYDPTKTPILLLPNSFGKKFDEICGVTKNGLIGLSEDQIMKFMNHLSKTINPADITRFAEICFELFLISPSFHFYRFAFDAFCYLLKLGGVEFQQSETSARILTLIATSKNDNEFELIKSHKSIFDKKYLTIWRMWLGQLIDLADTKGTFSFMVDLFVDIGYRALLYSKTRKRSEVENFLKYKLAGYPMPLDFFEKALNATFDCDLNDSSEEAISLINQSFPFLFANNDTPLNVLRISKSPKRLTKDLLLLSISTARSCYTKILIQRSTMNDGFPPEIKTLYQLANIMNQIMNNSYITRSRNLSLSSPFVFEIGPKYLLTVLDGELEILPFIYSQAVSNCENQFTKENCPPSDTLLKYIVGKTTQYEFVKNQHSMLLNYASQATFRHILTTSYHGLQNFSILLNPGSIPVISLDLESNYFKFDSQESSFRYSPNIERFFGGDQGIVLFELSMAATASSFVKYLENIRSVFELLIWEGKDLTTLEVDTIIKQRNLIEEKLFQIAPTSGASATMDNCNEWITDLDNLINRARDESLQPESAIPWF